MQFTSHTSSYPTAYTSIRTANANVRTGRRAAVALWSTQGLLALVFLFAGVSKLVMPAETLTQDTWLPAAFLRFIGLAETFGAIGLVLPWALGIRRALTPLAAAGLVVIMVGATTLTAAAGDVAYAAFPFAVGVAAAWVARERARAI
jgi:hypothetical protein